MSVLSVQNIQETLVGKNIARTANLQIANPAASAYIADGEITVINSSGAVYSAADSYANSPWIQLVQRNGDNLVFSSKIYGDKVTGVKEKAQSAGQEQIYHIGYNGSAGSFDITAGLDFQLTVIENQDDMMWSEQKKKNVVYVPNNLVTSQQDLAKAIVKNQMKKYTTDGSSITACMLNNGTAVAVTGTATSVEVTHGSNVVAGKIGTATGTLTNFGAGVVIRLGATGSGNGVTVPTYTIQGAHPTIANAFILDQPYAGPTNVNLLVANVGVLTTPGASWGVRFTGKALPFRRDFFKFKRVAFTLQMSGFGSTVLSKTQEAGYGNGDGRLVLEEESFSKGFEGALNRMTVPLPLANETFTADGSTTTTINTTYADAFVGPATVYNAGTLEFFSQDSATVVAVPRMPQLIKIFIANGAGQGGTDNTTLCVENQLNDWLGSLPGQPFGATPFSVF